MKNIKLYLPMLLASILFGTITVSGQFFANLGFSLYEISMYTLAVTAFVMLPVVLIRKDRFIKKGSLKFFALYGCVGALLQLAGFGGIVLGIPIAIVSLLMYSQPIYTTILSRIFFSELITKRKLFALLTAFLGLVVLLKPWEFFGGMNPIGVLSALLGGFFLSLWVVGGRKVSIDKEKPTLTTFSYALFTVVWLLILYPLFSFLVPNPIFNTITLNHPINFWVYLILIALISRVASNFLFYIGLKKLPASRAGIVMLVEPVSAAILASIFFLQPITINIIIGGALILLGNYIIITIKK